MENQFLVGYITKYKYVIQGNTEETNLRLSGVDLRRDNPEERIQFEKALLSACESLKKPIPELSNKPYSLLMKEEDEPEIVTLEDGKTRRCFLSLQFGRSGHPCTPYITEHEEWGNPLSHRDPVAYKRYIFIYKNEKRIITLFYTTYSLGSFKGAFLETINAAMKKQNVQIEMRRFSDVSEMKNNQVSMGDSLEFDELEVIKPVKNLSSNIAENVKRKRSNRVSAECSFRINLRYGPNSGIMNLLSEYKNGRKEEEDIKEGIIGKMPILKEEGFDVYRVKAKINGESKTIFLDELTLQVFSHDITEKVIVDKEGYPDIKMLKRAADEYYRIIDGANPEKW